MSKESRRSFLKKSTISGLGITLLGTKSFAKEENCPIPEDQQEPTTVDYYGQGPFYTPNAPRIENNLLANQDQIGERLILSGYILDANSLSPIPETEIDIWHANNQGAYDNDGYNLRGKIISDENGYYRFETIKPGLYLNGPTYRPSHIHFKITPPKSPSLITQLYFEEDSYIKGDRAASISQGNFDATDRIITTKKTDNGVYEGCWNVYFDTNEVINSFNHHLDKGSIYKVYASSVDMLHVNFGTHENGRAAIHLINLQGQTLSFVEKLTTSKGIQEVQLPINGLQNGTYLVQLIVNNHKTIPMKFVINH